MGRNAPTSVTMPSACHVPLSISFVTVGWLMSTTITLTSAGIMLPVAIEWSIVETMTTMSAPLRTLLYLRCASTTSVTTSGSGPSSRMDPARTNGTLFATHSYMMPLARRPDETIRLIDPALNTSFTASMWLRCPCGAGAPSLTLMPSDVPRVALSMSCTASALPASSPCMNPPRTSAATEPAAPVCTMAGPPTITMRPPPLLVRSMSSATRRAMRLVGLSLELLLLMNSNMPPAPRGRSGGATRTPASPVTTRSPLLTSRTGRQVARAPRTAMHLSIIMRSTPIQRPPNLTCVRLFVVQ